MVVVVVVVQVEMEMDRGGCEKRKGSLHWLKRKLKGFGGGSDDCSGGMMW